MKTCGVCNGHLVKKNVTVEREWNGRKMYIENVPAEVCEQCGESYFDAKTTLRLEKIKKAGISPHEKHISIPAFVRRFDQLSEG